MENNIGQFRRIYIHTEIADDKVDSGWGSIASKLESRRSLVFRSYIRSGAVLALIIFFLGSSVLVVTARPGSLLYSTKTSVQHAVSKLSNNLQLSNTLNKIPQPLATPSGTFIKKKDIPQSKKVEISPTPETKSSNEDSQNKPPFIILSPSPKENNEQGKQDVKGAHVEQSQTGQSNNQGSDNSNNNSRENNSENGNKNGVNKKKD